MTFQKNILTRAILATSLVAGLGFSQMALATESADGTLDIEAVIESALTVNCGTALNFATVALKLGSQGGNTTIVRPLTGDHTISSSQDAAVTGITNAGVCTVSGAASEDGNLTSVSFSSETVTLSKADNSAALTVGSFVVPDTITLSSNTVTFNIGGTLTIPDSLTQANMGSYTGTVDVTVTSPL